MTDEPVKTGQNRKPGTFAKGDARINRKGRPRVPKSAVELNKLIDEIAAEEVVNPNTGEQVQRIRAMLRGMMTGKDSRGKVEVLNRRYGKVKDEGDVRIPEGLTIKIVKASDVTGNSNK
jgi:hypothetical protein